MTVRETIEEYHNNFKTLLGSFQTTDKKNNKLKFFKVIEKVSAIIIEQSILGKKIMLIGNGGSAAISSHMAIDFWKNGGIRAFTYNDGSLLTCIGNDFGYKHIFEKPIEMFADKGDILFAISSSGGSENILRGVSAARNKGCSVITLSGFKNDNPLRSLGDFNFYVPSSEYGPVEVAHQYICHCILDIIVKSKNG